jgi:hypothetical protein
MPQHRALNAELNEFFSSTQVSKLPALMERILLKKLFSGFNQLSQNGPEERICCVNVGARKLIFAS